LFIFVFITTRFTVNKVIHMKLQDMKLQEIKMHDWKCWTRK